jgi:predicted dehydrogenase
MTATRIRIGIIGAGANTRRRHIPGFRKLDGVEIVRVANRTPASTARAAAELGIPHTSPCWQDLVEAKDVDAVLIGAWPNLHCEAVCAALAAGKHVLCEARMARNLDEARRMVAASLQHSHLVAQIVPSPYGLVCGPALEQLIREGFLGALRELVVLGADDQFWDYSAPLHWRQEADKVGRHILSLGILHETALRWSPPPTQVFAQTQLFEPTRPLPEECRMAEVTVPDSLQVVTKLAGGGRGIYHISGVLLFGPGKQIHLYGERGTIKVEFRPDGEERVWIGHAGDTELMQADIPDELLGRWRVEEEFIGAIRGQEQVELNDFATALKGMEFVEAVALSAERNAPVALPLTA